MSGEQQKDFFLFTFEECPWKFKNMILNDVLLLQTGLLRMHTRMHPTH